MPMEVSRTATPGSDTIRRAIVASVAMVYATITVLIAAYPNEIMLNSPVSATVTAGIAVSAAAAVVFRQKFGGLYGKTYVALAIGLACWFAGELVYTYDSVIMGSSSSSLSLAEVPWLMLYAFFGYYVFRTYRFFGYAVSRLHMISVLAGVSVLMAVTTYSILTALGPAVEKDKPLVIIRLIYPIGDAVLLGPSVLLLLTLRHGLLTYTPWLFVSVGLILIAGADIAFSNMSLFQIDLGPVVYPLYSAGNVAFAGALLWYNRFGIYDHGKALTAFQEGNR